MKSTVLTGTLCLALGFTIGWLSKPGRSEAVAITGDDPSTSATPKASPSTRIIDSPAVPSKAHRPEADTTTKKPAVTMGRPNLAMQERFENMIVDQARKKSSAKVAELAEKLGLSAQQAAALQAHFDNEIADITGDPNSQDGMPDMLALSKLQTNKSIDAALADILTDEQATAYEELKTNERNRQVESRAYKDLARVNSVLDLNDDQKNAVYDILYEQAAGKVDKSDDAGSAMAMVMNGHGIDIDVDDIGLGGIIESATALDSNGDPGQMSREDIRQSMREQNQKRINDQVDRLAPALTPEQAEQYRKHLESKSSGMFQHMLIEEGDPDGPTGVFKIETQIETQIEE
jgi:hypothetical protein